MLNKEDIMALAWEHSEGSGKRYIFTEESLFEFLKELKKEPVPAHNKLEPCPKCGGPLGYDGCDLFEPPLAQDGRESVVVAEVSLLNKQPLGVPMLREGGWTLQAGEKLVRQSDHIAALSAVTAERDGWHERAIQVLDKKKEWADRARKAEAEIEHLRAEVEALRGDAERWRLYRQGFSKPDVLDANADAAMAAKEE